MPKSALPFSVSPVEKTVGEDADSRASVEVLRLPLLLEDWFADCESGQISSRTLELRRVLCGRLLRFLTNGGYVRCGTRELRLFFAGLSNPRTGQPVRPITADTCRRNFSAFFNWLIAEGEIAESPVNRVRKPPVKKDIIQPLSQEPVEALVAAARRDANPVLRARNIVILLFLLNTGVRSNEILTLTYDNLDLTHRQAGVIGKGNKRRTVHFGSKAARAVRNYLRFESRTP